MRFVDTYLDVVRLRALDHFDMDVWKEYADRISPYLYSKVVGDVKDYDFEVEVLPVVKKAMMNKDLINTIHENYQIVTQNLNAKFRSCFRKTLDAYVILYLGLCNGAGWATALGTQRVVLIGIEKIIELEWYDKTTLFSLISHELGHIWHEEAGGAFGKQNTEKEKAVFQLFSEGIAMRCEQMLCGDDQFYHQGKDGWLSWCQLHKREIQQEYLYRVQNGIRIQDFFGDWCAYQGYSAVGYYLGCEFVKHLMCKQSLKQLAQLNNGEIYNELVLFVQ